MTEVISPYRIPVLNEICKSEAIQFKVFFLAETVPERLWRVEKEKIQFNYTVLPGLRIPLPKQFPIFFNHTITKALKDEAPDIVICGGYHHPSCFLALRYAKRYGKRVLLWSESHEDSVRLKGFPFDWYRNRFIHSCDGFLIPGRKSFDFIQSFGINGKKVWTAPNAVNNEFFSTRSKLARSHAEANRIKKGFPRKVILYVGRLIDVKGIPILLKAFNDISKSIEEVGLVLVGEGRDRRKYEGFCKKQGLCNVFFEGFKQQEDLPFYYGLADVFVLPSLQEEWGLVLNEAAASGLPLIGTTVSGAAFDLIEDGKNGYCVPAGDAESLKTRIIQILTDSQLKIAMGRLSASKSQEFSPSRCAKGFFQAILNGENQK